MGIRCVGGEDGVVALREGTSEIMHLKMLLKRRQGRTVANFDRFHLGGNVSVQPEVSKLLQ